MVVPKFGMRYLANTVAIIKGGDRQLRFLKIRKYNNKFFAIKGGGIYELDDQYEYRYFKTGVYFYNFNNSKPLSLSGMQEVDEKLRDVGDATLFNKERHVETMRMINPDQAPDPLEMPPDRTDEMTADTRRFLQDYQTDDEYAKTNMMVNVHLQKRSIPVYSTPIIPLGVNKGDFAIVQIGHRRIDIVPMRIHNDQAYTPYGVFEVTKDNQYMIKRQVLSFFVISEKEDDPAEKLPKPAQKIMTKMVNKKKWNLLKSFRKPRAANFKDKPKPRKEEKQPKNISLSSEKTLQQYKADDPSIFETTVKELYTSKVTVAEQLSDPLKKVIPIALIFGGVMGLMIVMSNAPMVIDKIAEYAGVQPPQVVYLSPFEAIERGLNPDIMTQACVEEYTQSQIPCMDYSFFNATGTGGVLPLSDPQHSLFGGDIPQDTFLDDLAGGGDETMIQHDTTAPILIMPEPIFENSDTRDGIIVRYNGLITASDDSGEYELLCEPKSGSIFYIGETVVKCSAVDGSGNATVGEFIITVTGNTEDRVGIIPEIVTTIP
jgi:hypothetical protein